MGILAGCSGDELFLHVGVLDPQVRSSAKVTAANLASQEEEELLREVDQLGELCRQSDGIWRPLLISCRCPWRTVFVVEQGCVAPKGPAFAGLLALQRLIDRHAAFKHGMKINHEKHDVLEEGHISEMNLFESGSHYVDVMWNGAYPIESWFEMIGYDATNILDGISVTLAKKPQSKTQQSILFNDAWMKQLKIWRKFATAMDTESFTSPAFIEIKNKPPEMSSDDVMIHQCVCGFREALKLTNNLLINNSPPVAATRLCEDLMLVMKQLTLEESKIIQSRHMRGFNHHCYGSCTVGVEWLAHEYRFSFDVLLSGEVALQRRLVLFLNEKINLEVSISPAGRILFSRFVVIDLNPKGNGPTYTSHAFYLDEAFKLISHLKDELGDLQVLRRKLEDTYNAPHTGAFLPVDSTKHLSFFPIGAAAMELGFALSQASFNQRLALNTDAIAAFLGEKNNAIDLLTNRFELLPNYYINRYQKENNYGGMEYSNVEALNEDESLDGAAMHGHQVTSIMMNDLPNIKIDLIGVDGYQQAAELPSQSAHRLCGRLRQNLVRVLNVSYGQDEYYASCAEFFTALAGECNEILIVAAAGNLNAELIGSSCPAGMDPFLENFITVASVDKSLHRLGQSSYSKKLVAIAAPGEEVPSLTAGFKMKNSYGTSVSAPQIANAALHLLARRNDLKPREVVERLKAHCFDDNLPVSCGGALNFDEFFFLEVDPYPNQLYPNKD